VRFGTSSAQSLRLGRLALCVDDHVFAQPNASEEALRSGVRAHAAAELEQGAALSVHLRHRECEPGELVDRVCRWQSEPR